MTTVCIIGVACLSECVFLYDGGFPVCPRFSCKLVATRARVWRCETRGAEPRIEARTLDYLIQMKAPRGSLQRGQTPFRPDALERLALDPADAPGPGSVPA